MLKKLETELKLRGYSRQTIKAYLYHNRNFLQHLNNKEPIDVTEDDLKGYIAHLLAEKGHSPATLALVKAALKFQYEEVLGKSLGSLKTPKLAKKVPTVLSKDEVRRLIN